jgi:hypothetical protein
MMATFCLSDDCPKAEEEKARQEVVYEIRMPEDDFVDLMPQPRSDMRCQHCNRPFKTLDALQRHIGHKHSSGLDTKGEDK